eukprot:1990-Eustigmatos_ZCMA.PRE.1
MSLVSGLRGRQPHMLTVGAAAGEEEGVERPCRQACGQQDRGRARDVAGRAHELCQNGAGVANGDQEA